MYQCDIVVLRAKIDFRSQNVSLKFHYEDERKIPKIDAKALTEQRLCYIRLCKHISRPILWLSFLFSQNCCLEIYIFEISAQCHQVLLLYVTFNLYMFVSNAFYEIFFVFTSILGIGV